MVQRQAAILAAILALSVLVPLAALAGTPACTETRMDGPGGSMEHVRVRSQGKRGICYACAGAQMADAIRFSVLKETNYDHQTSAMAVALGSSLDQGHTTADGGYACQAINYIAEKGSCDSRAVEGKYGERGLSRLYDQYDHLFTDFTGHVAAASDYAKAYQEVKNDALLLASPATMEKCPAAAPDTLLMLPPPDLVGELLKQDNRMKFLNDTIAYSCQDSKQSNQYRPFQDYSVSCDSSDKGFTSPEDFKSRLDSLLDQPGPLPIEIHYCAKTVVPNDGVPPEHHAGAEDDKCGAHASLVIGKRVCGDGKVKYLIRNSWGTECNRYRPGIECEEGKGNFWIDADELARSAKGLFPAPTIQAKPKPKPKAEQI